MILTHDNYHTLENRHLTNSRIKDFQRCKSYFKKRHITGELKQKGKDAFIIGSAVDTWLTVGKDAFIAGYLVVTRRNLKNPPTDYIELNQTQYNEVVNMCTVLESQPAYQDLATHKAQQIISAEFEVNEHFNGLACIPDWVLMDGDTCVLTDLKTANNTDERKHHYKCLDFGYYMQFAVETLIIRMNHPEIKKFKYRHLVIDKDPDGINTPYTFILDNEQVEAHLRILEKELIPMISKEREYNPKTVTWEDAPVVGSMEDEY